MFMSATDAMPFDEFRRRIHAVYAGPAHSPRTAYQMDHVLALVQRLGCTSIADVTTELAAKYVAWRCESVCATTVLGELCYLRSAVNYAIEEGWIDRKPQWHRVRPRAGPRRKKVLHSIGDIARVLALLKSRSAEWTWNRLYALVGVVAYTGLRRDEALHLQVADVHLSDRLILVVARRRLKTQASAAPVPICSPLRAILAQWIPRVGSPWLFPGVRRTGPWIGGSDGTRPTDRVRAVGAELGIDGLTLQSLRHTFATWSRRRWGLSALQLRDVLRHTTEHTQEHYVHGELDFEELIRSVRKVRYHESAGRAQTRPSAVTGRPCRVRGASNDLTGPGC
jgi:integrase